MEDNTEEESVALLTNSADPKAMAKVTVDYRVIVWERCAKLLRMVQHEIIHGQQYFIGAIKTNERLCK